MKDKENIKYVNVSDFKEMDKIVSLMVSAAKKLKNEDPVSCLHAIVIGVSMKIAEVMENMRNEEREKERKLKAGGGKKNNL